MKLSTAAAILFILPPIAMCAQTDAGPPETKAPAPMQRGSDMAGHVKPDVKPSSSVTVVYRGASTVLTVGELMKLPQVKVTVRDGHTNKDVEFTGPLVADVLAKGGLVASPETHSLILHSTVVATGADGFYALYSGGEVEPGFSSARPILAIMRFELPNTEGGMIQIVDPQDVSPSRWVNGVTTLSVMTLAQSK